jgi:predicted RNase H-like HicB family nuclease
MAGRTREFSSVVNKEGKWYVATCPELGIASQGKSVENSIDNLREAIELYLEDDGAEVPAANYRPLVTVVKVGRA